MPRYLDESESDIFILAGAEDLIPVFKKGKKGNTLYDSATKCPIFHDEIRDGYSIRRYSPRVDQAFARIERWTKVSQPSLGNIHWRTISRDNVTSIYGKDDNSKIYDPTVRPDDPEHCLSWLISETYDTRGNAIIYNYYTENSVGVSINQPHEANRSDLTRSANRYIKTIRYGNKVPNRDNISWDAFSAFNLSDNEWMFTVAFDYGNTIMNFQHSTGLDPSIGFVEKIPSPRIVRASRSAHIDYVVESSCSITFPLNFKSRIISSHRQASNMKKALRSRT
jgi:hypothetical protein